MDSDISIGQSFDQIEILKIEPSNRSKEDLEKLFKHAQNNELFQNQYANYSKIDIINVIKHLEYQELEKDEVLIAPGNKFTGIYFVFEGQINEILEMDAVSDTQLHHAILQNKNKFPKFFGISQIRNLIFQKSQQEKRYVKTYEEGQTIGSAYIVLDQKVQKKFVARTHSILGFLPASVFKERLIQAEIKLIQDQIDKFEKYFENFDSDKMKNLFLQSYRIQCYKNQKVYRQGGDAKEVYIAMSGKYSLTQKQDNIDSHCSKSYILGVFKKDDIFGLKEIFTHTSRRQQNVNCLQSGELLVIRKYDFDELIKDQKTRKDIYVQMQNLEKHIEKRINNYEQNLDRIQESFNLINNEEQSPQRKSRRKSSIVQQRKSSIMLKDLRTSMANSRMKTMDYLSLPKIQVRCSYEQEQASDFSSQLSTKSPAQKDCPDDQSEIDQKYKINYKSPIQQKRLYTKSSNSLINDSQKSLIRQGSTLNQSNLQDATNSTYRPSKNMDRQSKQLLDPISDRLGMQKMKKSCSQLLLKQLNRAESYQSLSLEKNSQFSIFKQINTDRISGQQNIHIHDLSNQISGPNISTQNMEIQSQELYINEYNKQLREKPDLKNAIKIILDSKRNNMLDETLEQYFIDEQTKISGPPLESENMKVRLIKQRFDIQEEIKERRQRLKELKQTQESYELGYPQSQKSPLRKTRPITQPLQQQKQDQEQNKEAALHRIFVKPINLKKSKLRELKYKYVPRLNTDSDFVQTDRQKLMAQTNNLRTMRKIIKAQQYKTWDQVRDVQCQIYHIQNTISCIDNNEHAN